jgi:hypothetical protein
LTAILEGGRAFIISSSRARHNFRALRSQRQRRHNKAESAPLWLAFERCTAACEEFRRAQASRSL